MLEELDHIGISLPKSTDEVTFDTPEFTTAVSMVKFLNRQYLLHPGKYFPTEKQGRISSAEQILNSLHVPPRYYNYICGDFAECRNKLRQDNELSPLQKRAVRRVNEVLGYAFEDKYRIIKYRYLTLFEKKY